MDREEALKIVRDLYEKSLFLKKDKEAVATLIPELKESEDERIRKWILDGLDFYSDAIDAPEDHKKAIAYLEKQKDEAQKQFNLGVQAGREEVMYEMEKEQDKCPEYCVRSHCIGCSIYEKQKEQKSIEDVVKDITKDKETTTKFLKSAGIVNDNGELSEMYRSDQKPIISAEESLGISQEEYNTIVDECIYGENEEQKPAECIEDSVKFDEGFKTGREVGFREGVESVKPAEWSEEDENCRHDILLSLEALCSSASSTDTYIVYKHLIDWLKSLSERFNLQPKQEWSEEEQQTISFAVDWLTKMLERTNVPEAKRDIESVILGLKSLRPQPKEESNEEKIMNFFDAIGDCGFTQADILKLKSIWKECELPSPQSHWKPSEEQMNHLGYAYTQLKLQKCYAPHVYETLGSLYDDLKKL